jgi:hypothetical protein
MALPLRDSPRLEDTSTCADYASRGGWMSVDCLRIALLAGAAR